MKTSKLWIWSIIFGLCATVILYIFMNSSEEPQVAVTANVEAKEIESTTDNQEATPEETIAQTVEEEFKNEMLPVSKGKRAISIAVAEVEGVSGFIKPGAHVDVAVKFTVPEEALEGQHPSVTLLIQNVKVLAVGHAADDLEKMKRYQNVTLEVSIEEGLALGFATQYELYLLLRTEGDDELEPKHTHIHEDEIHKGVFKK